MNVLNNNKINLLNKYILQIGLPMDVTNKNNSNDKTVDS